MAREASLRGGERGEGEHRWSESEEGSSNPSSPSSPSLPSSPSSLSSCGSDSEGEDGFHPGRLGLGEEVGVVSFQLEEDDYPEEVTRCGGEEEISDSASHPSPPPSPSPLPSPSSHPLLPTSVRLSPILQGRRSSLPHI